MLYGEIGAARNSINPIKQVRAYFAGAGSLTLTTTLRNFTVQGSALFAGVGNIQPIETTVSNPFWQGSAAFTGTGNLSALGFIPLAANVADYAFDENTGTTLTDSVGANNGTLVNTPSWVAGRTGYALSFNGSTQSVTVGTFDPIPNGTEGSISVWIKPSDYTNGANHYAIAKGDDLTNGSWGLDIIGDGSAAAAYIIYYVSNPIAAHYTAAVIPNDSNFHHVVAIFGNIANRKIYVDNVNQSLSTIGTPPSTHVSSSSLAFNIAKTSRASPNTYFYAGAIDNLKIFNRVLTADEISNLYYLS